MIKIHFDFTDGTEVSYIEGCNLKDNFTTNCLDFFNNDEAVDDVIVIDMSGNTLSRKLLMLDGDLTYTKKAMQDSHNLQKMLKGGAFNWRNQDKIKKPTKEEFGFLESTGFDGEPSGFVFEGAEEAYEKAMEIWEYNRLKG